jgi:ribonuclease BN (tRNA processing enzyme)
MTEASNRSEFSRRKLLVGLAAAPAIGAATGPAYLAHMKADHAPVEDVGRIAAEAGVKTLVLSHLTPAIDSISDDTWRAPAAKYFGGEIIVAHDLMVL